MVFISALLTSTDPQTCSHTFASESGALTTLKIVSHHF